MGNIGDPYATLDEFKNRLRLEDFNGLDGPMQDALDTASRDIEENYCHRQFNKLIVATPRVYAPLDFVECYVDDFWTTDGLIVEVDTTGDGTYDQTWSPNDYELEPLNGVVNGRPGWPYTKLVSCNGKMFRPLYYFPSMMRRARVRVTAQWGWETVPAPVKEGCLMLASEAFGMKDAPFGVAGFGDFGVVRVRSNPIIKSKLDPFDRTPVMQG